MTVEQAMEFQELINDYIKCNTEDFREWKRKKSESPINEKRSYENNSAFTIILSQK